MGIKKVLIMFNFMETNLPIKIALIILFLLIIIIVIYLILYKKGSIKRKGNIKRKFSMNKTKRNTCKIEPIDKDYRLSFGNVQHIGKRDDQQDAFAISDNKDKVLSKEKGVFAIVADGMGGLDNGRESSNLVVTSMMRYFTEKPFLSSIPLELRNMVVSTNSDLLDHLSRTSNSKSGSTLVAIIIRDNELFWISVGDSRIYLYRKNRLYLLNRDHNYVNDLFQEVNDGKITLEDALIERL
jgi:hypothetical protein